MTDATAQRPGGRGASPVPRLHLVTDDAVLARPGFGELAEELLARAPAPFALHVRGPATGGGALLRAASRLAAAAGPSGAWVVVNDRVDVALAAGAHAVHLGGRSLPLAEARRLLGPGRRLGISVHAEEEARNAAGEGTDWVFAGTIYATPSHPGRGGRGPSFLGRVAAAAPGVPVLAIGGVTEARVGDVVRAGAWGVAVIRGVWDAPDPRGALQRYLHALASAMGSGGAGPHQETP